MKKVLVIYTSPTILSKRGSISSLMAKEFIKFYKENNDDEVIELDLNSLSMASKTLTSINFSTFFNENDSDYYIEQLKSVDKVVLAAPMTNFNYPAVLKNYFDHILLANKTFRYKYNSNGESEGLLKHLKVQLLTTQGADFGWYPWGDVAKMAKGTWEFMGANVVKAITIFGTKTPKKINLSAKEVVNPKLKEIEEIAKNF